MENFHLVKKDYGFVQPFLELHNQPDLWTLHEERQKHANHRDTRAIFLRWAHSLEPGAVFTDIAAWDRIERERLPGFSQLIEQIVDDVGGLTLGRVMLVELKRDGYILPHIDEGLYADTYERFHLPVLSEPGNMFYGQTAPGQGEFVHMKAGELWWFNHKRPHWVYNGSGAPRLHLIVDVIAPAHRKEREVSGSSYPASA